MRIADDPGGPARSSAGCSSQFHVDWSWLVGSSSRKSCCGRAAAAAVTAAAAAVAAAAVAAAAAAAAAAEGPSHCQAGTALRAASRHGEAGHWQRPGDMPLPATARPGLHRADSLPSLCADEAPGIAKTPPQSSSCQCATAPVTGTAGSRTSHRTEQDSDPAVLHTSPWWHMGSPPRAHALRATFC